MARKKSKQTQKSAPKSLIMEEYQKLRDQGISHATACRQLAKKFNKSPETIRHWFKGGPKPLVKSNGNQLLTDEEEAIVIGWILTHSEQNRPLNSTQIMNGVNAGMFQSKKANIRDWYRSFMSRHSDVLAARVGHEMKPARTEDKVYEDIQKFIHFYPDWLKKNDVNPEWLINADETRVLLSQGQKGQKVVGRATKKVAATMETIKGKAISFIPFVAANGTRIMDVFIIPGGPKGSVFDIKRCRSSPRKGTPAYFGFSEHGYLNDRLWFSIIERLCDHLTRLKPVGNPALILDQLGSHKSPYILNLYQKVDLKVLFFPKNCSHLLQPCDDKVFAVFKRKLQLEYSNSLVTLNASERDAGALLAGLAQDIANSITPDVIKSSFRETGLFPWDPVLIESRAHNLIKSQDSNDSELVKKCTKYVKDAMKQFEVPKSTKRIRVEVSGSGLFDAREMLQIVEKNESDKKAAARAREIKKEEISKKKKAMEVRKMAKTALQCKGEHGNSTLKWKETLPSADDWQWCVCDMFGLCPECFVLHKDIMDVHEANCPFNDPNQATEE